MFLILDEIKKENKHLNFMVSHKVIASDERVISVYLSYAFVR